MSRVSLILLIVGLCCSLELASARVNPLNKVKLQERLCAVDSRYCEGLVAHDEPKDIKASAETAVKEEEEKKESDKKISESIENKTDAEEAAVEDEEVEDEEDNEENNAVGLEVEDEDDNSYVGAPTGQVNEARAGRRRNNRFRGRGRLVGRRRNTRGRRRGRGRGRRRRGGRRG